MVLGHALAQLHLHGLLGDGRLEVHVVLVHVIAVLAVIADVGLQQRVVIVLQLGAHDADLTVIGGSQHGVLLLRALLAEHLRGDKGLARLLAGGKPGGLALSRLLGRSLGRLGRRFSRRFGGRLGRRFGGRLGRRFGSRFGRRRLGRRNGRNLRLLVLAVAAAGERKQRHQQQREQPGHLHSSFSLHFSLDANISTIIRASP